MPAHRLTTTPRRAALALPVLTLLAVLAPVPPAAAGPPEAMSGRMVFDQVADGLRKYRRETASGRRIRWLRKLAPTRDARVAIALGDAWGDADGGLGSAAQRLLAEHYCPPGDKPGSHVAGEWARVTDGWQKNEADLRRRAKELPR